MASGFSHNVRTPSSYTDGVLLSGRTILIGLSIVIVAVGIGVLLAPGEEARVLAAALIGGGALSVIVILSLRPKEQEIQEPDHIRDLSESRLRELARGTSKSLRDMEYRYSVQLDFNPTERRRPFIAEVNSIRLGFYPSLIIENASDRTGFGYLAFMYDGKRWRGPGLPCPDGQAAAVRHATNCVSPLAKEDETSFEATEAEAGA